MKKIILPVVVILIVILAIVMWMNRSSEPAETQSDTQTTTQTEQPVAQTPTETPPQEEEPKPTPPPTNTSGGTFSGEEDITSPDISVFEVTYDGSSFSPASLDVKVGDIVIFKNTSSKSFEPASDPHPTHTIYSGFDAGSPIAAGGKFEFKFTKAGTWGYHDHLNSSAKGTIKVTQ